MRDTSPTAAAVVSRLKPPLHATSGQSSFGALLAPNGTVLLTAQNTMATDRDPTAHAESNLVAEAIRRLTPESDPPQRPLFEL